MKLLTICAYYPPCHSGGYEIRIQNIMDELASRGYEIQVVTSMAQAEGEHPGSDGRVGIARCLHGQTKKLTLIDRMTLHRITRLVGVGLAFLRQIFFDLHDLAAIDGFIRQFRPDVIYVGHVAPLSRTILPFLAGLDIPVVFDEGGAGIIYFREDKGVWYRFVEDIGANNRLVKGLKMAFVRLVCALSRDRLKSQRVLPAKMQVIYNGRLAVQMAVEHSVVMHPVQIIHSGIQIQTFPYSGKPFENPITIILPGRLEPLKGQLDGIRMLAKLKERQIDARMIIVGEKLKEAYFSKIRSEARLAQVEERVTFLPMVTQAKLAELYQQADVCFFSSHHHSGFSRTPLEAMASGCVVISYGNEGSDEVIRDRENGFLVGLEDYPGMAVIIAELISNPALADAIRRQARRDIEVGHSMETYVDQIEQVILETRNRFTAGGQ